MTSRRMWRWWIVDDRWEMRKAGRKRAIHLPSSICHPHLFMAERFDRVERGGTTRGHEAEEDADGSGENEGDAVDLGIEGKGCADERGQPHAEPVGQRD